MKLKKVLENKKKNITFNNSLEMLVISNITVESVFIPCLTQQFTLNEKNIKINCMEFNELYSVYNSSILQKSKIIFIWINLNELMPQLYLNMYRMKENSKLMLDKVRKEVGRTISQIHSISDAKLIWSSFEDYYDNTEYINGEVISEKCIADVLNYQIKLEHPEIIMLDIKSLIAQLGFSKAYDKRSRIRWNMPYTVELMQLLSKNIYKQCELYFGKPKKCLVLDCDNVLWGGVIAEDGEEQMLLGTSGIGRLYYEFQMLLLTLYYHGIILTVCSKNSLEDVLNVFQKHNEMLLKEENIAYFCVNWNNKVENIIHISEAINIDPDSMVFIDDSQFEISSVKDNIPDIVAIKFDPYHIYDALTSVTFVSNTDVKIIEERIASYKMNTKRNELKSASLCYEDYMKSLHTQVDIKAVTEYEIERVSELTRRANKFTNGIRKTVDEIIIDIKNGHNYFYVSVSDRFGDYGIVGVIGVHHKVLNVFTMSCRIAGRGIEDDMTKYIHIHYPVEQIQSVNTIKNTVFLDYLRNKLL